MAEHINLNPPLTQGLVNQQSVFADPLTVADVGAKEGSIDIPSKLYRFQLTKWVQLVKVKFFGEIALAVRSTN